MNSHRKTRQPIECPRNSHSTDNLSEKTSPEGQMILRTNTTSSNNNFTTESTLLFDTEKIVLSSTGIES